MFTNVVIFITVAVIVFLLAGSVSEGKDKRSKLINRLKQRSQNGKPAQDISLRRKTEKTQGFLLMLEKLLPNFTALSDRLESANIRLTAKQYALRRIIWMMLVVAVVSGLFHKSLLLGLFLGFIIGVWVPLKLMQRVINKRNKAFLRLFPDAIDLIVRGLRSGLPVSESIVLVSTEVPDPVGSIFLNISQTMKLGVSLEKALQETARKLGLTEFNFFTTSIVLQRETGGNLSEILNNLSEVLRGRFIMGMKIKAMSSEARASAMIIGALPFVVILAVSVTTPTYLLPLINDPTGNKCAFAAVFMMSFGLWVMNRMTKFEI